MTSRRRLAIVLGQLDLGGSEGQALALAEALSARGHDVRVFSFRSGPRRAAALSLPCTVPAVPWLGGGVTAFAAWLRRFRPHAVYTFTFRANLWGRMVARAAGVPVVVTAYRQERYFWFDRLTLGWSDAVVCNCRRVADMVQERYRLPDGRVHVIPNGVDMARWEGDAEDARRALGFDAAAPVVVQVARLHPGKDHDTALRALEGVRRGLPGVRLLLVGDGPRRRALARRIDDMGLAAHVRMLGGVADVAPLLAAARVVWLTSRTEGLPNALLEAMASGRPVVATRTGGVPEVLRDTVEGFLVERGDDAAIAAHTARLLAEPDLAQALGEAGRRRARDFGMTAMFDRSEALLERLVAGRLAEAPAPAGVASG